MVDVKNGEVWIVSDNKTLPKLLEIAAHNTSKGYELKYITDIGKAVELIRRVGNGTEQKPKLMVTDIENEKHNGAQEMLKLASSAGIEAVPMKELFMNSCYIDISRHNFSDKKPANQISM